MAARPDGERCTDVTIKSELPGHVMVLYTPVDTRFPGLPETLSLFELFKGSTQQLLVVIDYGSHY